MSSPLPLLLLDLDDTLLDTSGQLAPLAHREVVTAMMAAGLPGDFNSLLEERRSLLGQVPPELLAHAQVALYPTLEHPDLVAEVGKRAYFQREVGEIYLEPGVMEMLLRLKHRHTLVLVTAGYPPTQQQKVSRLGLEWLDEIHVVEAGMASKQACFAKIADRLGFLPHQVGVIGDRPDVDIAAGRALGMWTIRVCRGEHERRVSQPWEEAHVEIQRILDLEKALSILELQESHRFRGIDPHQS